MEHPSLFWRLGVIYVEFGVWLWGIAPACFIAWLLAKRKVILTNAIPGKQIAFLSLGVGSVLTLVFWMTMAVVLLPGAEIGEGVAFYFLNSLMSPLIFMAGTGVGLAYNVVRL
jgi:hypothetical protein